MQVLFFEEQKPRFSTTVEMSGAIVKKFTYACGVHIMRKYHR